MLTRVVYRALIVQACAAGIWLTVSAVTTAVVILCGVPVERLPALTWLTFCGMAIAQELRLHRRPYPAPAPAAAQLADMRETLLAVLRRNGRVGVYVVAIGAAFAAGTAFGLFIDDQSDWWLVPWISLAGGIVALRETMWIRTWELDHLDTQLVEAHPDEQPRYTLPRGWGDERAAGDR
jgi:MFS family permease